MRPDAECPWRWVVDPLDGTMNFAHGFPFWCVSIALEHAGRLVVGVVHHPLTGEVYSASLGQGATRDGLPIHVSAVETLEQSLISAALPLDFAADSGRQLAYMGRLRPHPLGAAHGVVGLNLALLAAGGFDVCYATAMNPWDAAAGVVLVREAGGTVTRFSGETYDLYTQEILASNGRVHDHAVSALKEAWPR